MQQLLDIEDKMTSLGRVAAGMAHEIRSPLTAITLFLNNLDLICSENERIEDETLDDIKEIIAESLDASQNIETVVKRVIDFSKPSVTSISSSPINQPIYQALKLSDATLKKKGINLHLNLASDSQFCYLDIQRLKTGFFKFDYQFNSGYAGCGWT